MSKFCSTLRLRVVLFTLLGAAALMADADAAIDAPNPLDEAVKAAQTAFADGQFAQAATSLETVIAGAADTPQLEPVYFMLGSAYFNGEEYPKAIDIFTKFKAKFPKSEQWVNASFSMGQAYFFTKKYAEAAAEFKALAKIAPKFRQESQIFLAEAFQLQGKIPEAIGVLEELIQPEITTPFAARAGLMLAPLYAEQEEFAKGILVLTNLKKKIGLVENVVQLNSVAIKFGDKLMEGKEFPDALSCYRIVLPKEEVIRLQKERILAMKHQMDDNIAVVRANPKLVTDMLPINNRLRALMDTTQKLLDEFDKLPPYAPTLDLRMGRAFYELDKKWESIVAYEEVTRRYKTSPECESALFGLVVSLVDLQRSVLAQQYASRYLADFPEGPNAGTVGYLMGAVLLQNNDYAGAEVVFKRVLASQPKSSFREEMTYLLGNCQFLQGNYEEAEKTFVQYKADFPHGIHAEDISYRIAAGTLFEGRSDDAVAPLTSYIKTYPGGSYAADAKYRLGVCKSAQQKFDEVVALCRDWQKDYPGNPELPEILSLQGDGLAGLDKVDEAIDSYTRAFKTATSTETIKYALFDGAQKLMQKKGDWEGMASMFEEFAKKNPDSPFTLLALYWIGKARVHQDRPDDAKKFLAASVKQFMPDRKRDAVEQILTLLVQLVAKRTASAASSDASSPSASPTPLPDARPDLEALLGSPLKTENPTSRSRIVYSEAKLLQLRKQPKEADLEFQEIGDRYKPADLSATVLAETGDYLVTKGSLDKAAAFYKELEDSFAKSDLLDYARVGLGEISYKKGDYKNALKQFSAAVDQTTTTLKLKDATMGQARTFLKLGKMAEARKAFQQVASVREWRGPATAESVFNLGQIAASEGKLPEAIAFYQRVYVAYQRYLPWVAKAYLESGSLFEKMNKKPEALKTYQEMIRNEKLATFPELEQARKRLESLGT